MIFVPSVASLLLSKPNIKTKTKKIFFDFQNFFLFFLHQEICKTPSLVVVLQIFAQYSLPTSSGPHPLGNVQFVEQRNDRRRILKPIQNIQKVIITNGHFPCICLAKSIVTNVCCKLWIFLPSKFPRFSSPLPPSSLLSTLVCLQPRLR